VLGRERLCGGLSFKYTRRCPVDEQARTSTFPYHHCDRISVRDLRNGCSDCCYITHKAPQWEALVSVSFKFRLPVR
jgi:hypothetical protein